MTAAAITESDVRATSLSAGTELDQLCINTIRTLAMDAVQQAKSGHPGTPMALAPLAYVIWQHFLRFDPEGSLRFTGCYFVQLAGLEPPTS
jgi:transketolase